MAGSVKAWKYGQPGEPAFPSDYEVTKKAVLQVTDIKTNRNKYYCVELHTAQDGGKPTFRVFTHYGRTDDLDSNPNAGQKETRYLTSLPAAEAEYMSIYREKTSARKGYKELALASSKIGSQKSIGQSVGHMDQKTLQKIEEQKSGKPKAAPKKQKLDLPPALQELVKYIYAEATDALTSTVNAKITAAGIETPLGVLTIGQVEKGEKILEQAYDVFKKDGKNKKSELERLSGEFYTVVPHRIGRSRQAIEAAVIDSLAQFEQKQETLQLMKDMLQVNGESHSVLVDPEVDGKYRALSCAVTPIEKGSPQHEELAAFVVNSQVKHKNVKVKNVFALRREAEAKGFREDVGNHRLMFHGSRIRNWVGILSRGLLMPKIVVSMGVNRTDAGWLGNGIYFGDAACTSAFYTTAGSRGTRFMAVHTVALGKIKEYTKITYGLASPPAGYDSCHGVPASKVKGSQFQDDEFVIYDPRQQRQDYLVEFAM
jgi:poly [ADP-ribose] polymerase 2/3/4